VTCNGGQVQLKRSRVRLLYFIFPTHHFLGCGVHMCPGSQFLFLLVGRAVLRRGFHLSPWCSMSFVVDQVWFGLVELLFGVFFFTSLNSYLVGLSMHQAAFDER
jgi:hypothetical protein